MIRCKLFVAHKKLNSFAIKQIQTLSTKHRGMGYHRDSSAPSAPQRYHCRSSFSPLTPFSTTHTQVVSVTPLAATHTKTASRKCLSLPHIQKRRGVGANYG